MTKAFTIDTAQNTLSKLSDRYVLLSYVNSKSKATFFDKDRNIEFDYKYGMLLQKLKKNADFVPMLSPKERYQKRIKYWQNNFGVDNPFQVVAIKNKIKQSNLKNNGVEYPMQSASIQEKSRKSFEDNYGVAHALQSKAIKEKYKQTCMKNYGVENPSQSEEIKEKKKQTCLDHFGVEYSGQAEEVKKKIQDSRIKNGTIALIDGKTLGEWARDVDRSYSGIQSLYNKDIDITKLVKYESILETQISSFLDILGVNYLQNKVLEGSSYRPDFVLLDYKIIIECDGLYWHSDAVKEDNKYHQKKQEVYTKLGYRSLFFREDEILNKFSIVESIITNALSLNTLRLFARKCETKSLDPSFFSDYHLMGKGAGRSYGLFYDNNPVLGIQVKWVNKKIKLLEISRMCSAPNTSVVGGFSKLLKYIEKVENPSIIRTFIDKRYGEGNYLSSLGFEEQTTYLSFKWTKQSVVYKRMKFENNLGYEYGFSKIWDCGQTKWIKYYD